MDRYDAMFALHARRNEGAFVPFVMLGDPDLERCEEVIDILVRSGADALELGIPFSDPIADGPVIQEAARRALTGGVTPGGCFELLARVRQKYPELPVGLLVYANLVFHKGIETFYQRCARAGVDSVLVADVPVHEASPFVDAARAQKIAPVLIAPPNASRDVLEHISRLGEGYTYIVTRSGVTGVRDKLSGESKRQIELLAALDAPPPVLGFGISTPDHVRAALALGAYGAISGSAVVRRVAAIEDSRCGEGLEELASFIQSMKEATRMA